MLFFPAQFVRHDYIRCIAAMICCDINHPFFIKIFFTILNGLPYSLVFVCPLLLPHHPIFTIAMTMSHFICIFQIYPGQVRCNSSDICCCSICYCFINQVIKISCCVMRITDSIQFQSIKIIIRLKIACFFCFTAYQFRPVIKPC